MKHTPGKWIVEGEGIVTNPVTGAAIGTTRIGTGGYGELELIDSTNEPEGNKYLIAAAPDMLEALEWALREVEGFQKRTGIPQFMRWISNAEQTIKKAKGGE